MELEIMTTMNNQMVKVGLPVVRNKLGFPPVDFEWVWGKEVSDGIEIDNVPFFADYSYGDLISARRSEEGLVLDLAIRRSGNAKVLYKFVSESDLARMKGELIRAGLVQESWASKLLLVVEIPRQTDAALARSLAAECQATEFVWR